MVHAIAMRLPTFEVIRERRLLEECFGVLLPPESTHEELCECQILWDAGNCVLWELRKQLSGGMPRLGMFIVGVIPSCYLLQVVLLCQFECSNNVLLVESELWAKFGRDL